MFLSFFCYLSSVTHNSCAAMNEKNRTFFYVSMMNMLFAKHKLRIYVYYWWWLAGSIHCKANCFWKAWWRNQQQKQQQHTINITSQWTPSTISSFIHIEWTNKLLRFSYICKSVMFASVLTEWKLSHLNLLFRNENNANGKSNNSNNNTPTKNSDAWVWWRYPKKYIWNFKNSNIKMIKFRNEI